MTTATIMFTVFVFGGSASRVLRLAGVTRQPLRRSRLSRGLGDQRLYQPELRIQEHLRRRHWNAQRRHLLPGRYFSLQILAVCMVIQ